eukprot:3864639-Pyramimonas_sp.AAC.1
MLEAAVVVPAWRRLDLLGNSESQDVWPGTANGVVVYFVVDEGWVELSLCGRMLIAVLMS